MKFSFEQNRHCVYGMYNNWSELPVLSISELRENPDDLPRRAYHRIKHKLRSVQHWGQLKLLLTEIKFLDRFAVAGYTWNVVYVGGGPGNHIPLLVNEFPQCNFTIYDPVRFCEILEVIKPPRVTLINRFFDEEDANEWAQRENVLFISDIRNSSIPEPVRDDDNDDETVGVENPEIQDDIIKDMKTQYLWCKVIMPYAGMLKFRLPWGDKKEPFDSPKNRSPYLSGDVWIQPWAPPTSTECRLVFTREDCLAPDRIWDHKTYEEQMMFHNSVARVCAYDHQLDASCMSKVIGLDHCFDCTMTIQILRMHFLIKLGGTEYVPELDDSVVRFINDAVKLLSKKRTLATMITQSTTKINSERLKERHSL